MAAAEQKKSYQVVKEFKGVNTKANRTAIDTAEFSWLENAMPIGYGNLKIVPNVASVGVLFPSVIANQFSCNIGVNDYLVFFETDGSAEYINITVNPGARLTLAAAGTFSGTGAMNVSQWKNQYLLICDPVKGYFTWDGTNLVFIGSVGTVGIISGGNNYTSAPSVTISAPNQTGGVQATAVATVTANAVSSITLTQAGSGYTTAPTVTITGGGGANANAVAGLVTFAQGTLSVFVTNGGSGYTNAANTVVTISGGGGSGAAGKAVVSGGQVTQVVMTNPGSGYFNSAAVTVSITGGGAAPNSATANAVVNTGTNSGIQSFSGRVWIANGRTVTYSAAGSYNDFTSVSAGATTLADATLHGNITQLLSANNFLYLFGDDSINVFSDVRVTNTGVTLFTNTNISASVGSKRPYAIFPYFRSVLFLNDYGVYALVGSTTSKISDPLDGVFPYIDFTKPITGGQVLLNNILCAAFNFYYNGPGGGNQGGRYIQAVFFEKKWFFTNQGSAIQQITSIPVEGKINLFGSTDTVCSQLFSDATTLIPSYVQTALFAMGDPIRTKQALKFAIEGTGNSGSLINVTVDSETGSSPNYALAAQAYWANNAGQIIPWTGVFVDPAIWTQNQQYYLYKSDASQYGKYLGLTVQSTANAAVYNTFEFEHELRTRF